MTLAILHNDDLPLGSLKCEYFFANMEKVIYYWMVRWYQQHPKWKLKNRFNVMSTFVWYYTYIYSQNPSRRQPMWWDGAFTPGWLGHDDDDGTGRMKERESESRVGIEPFLREYYSTLLYSRVWITFSLFFHPSLKSNLFIWKSSSWKKTLSRMLRAGSFLKRFLSTFCVPVDERPWARTLDDA